MAYKLITTGQRRWRKINAPHLLEQVRQGVRFQDGIAVPAPPRRSLAATPEPVAA